MFQYFFETSRESDSAFYDELIDFYRQNSNRLQKTIRDERQIMIFCTNYRGILDYENLCRFALILSNAVGARLPDSIHNRMVLGPSNKWVQEYIEYTSNLKPLLFGLFNLNRKKISDHYLSSNGTFRQKGYKC